MSGRLAQTTFDASAMSGGFHTISVTTENTSGVQSVTQEEFLVVGSSNAGTNMFEFRSSTVGDVITIDMYENLHADSRMAFAMILLI